MKILDIPRSGSYAGVTSSHNRAGQYVRNRRAPVQPIGTGRRAAVRAAFGAAASGFAGLLTATQDAWTMFANGHPITDSLGQSIVLTGQQMFVRMGANLQNTGSALPVTPPADLTLPNITDATLTYSIATGASISFTGGTGAQKVAVGMSQPVSSGRRFWKTFWQPPGGDGWILSNASPYTLTPIIYQGQFGPPVIGQRIFARVTGYSADGWNSPAAIISAIVTA